MRGANKATETCSCGSRIDLEGTWSSDLAERLSEWREGHQHDLLDHSAVTKLEPGDRVLVFLGKATTPEQFEAIRRQMNEAIPDVEVLLLAGAERVVVEPDGHQEAP